MPGPIAHIRIGEVATVSIERDGDLIRIDDIKCGPGWKVGGAGAVAANRER